MEKNTKDIAKIFKALSDENRLKILLSVYANECKCNMSKTSCRNKTCIKDLSKLLDITTPTISHHIKELVNTDLITTKKEGRWVFCKINQETFQKTSKFINKLFNKE